MRRNLTWTYSSLLAMTIIWGCAAANERDRDRDDDDDDEGGNGGTSGQGVGGAVATGGASGTGTTTGGAPPTTGGTGGGVATGGAPPTTGGTAGAGGVTTGGSAGTGTATGGAAGGAGMCAAPTCSNTDLSTLPIDANGRIDPVCNERGIQGSWYCYDDRDQRGAAASASDCVPMMVPYRAGAGMCISGNTVVDETYGAWGAGIAVALNDTGEQCSGAAPVKSAYNATMNGVTGFNVEITGTTGNLPIRIGFTGANPQVGAAPFVEVPGPGTYEVPIATANVPSTWETDPNAGMAADPANIWDMQIQIVGATAAADYDFCVASVTPITDGSPPVGGTLMPYGSQLCGDNFAKINLGSRYMVQNNVYNGGGGGHCIQAAWDNADKAGFTVGNVNLNIAPGGAPGSYPSIVYGWHVDGQMYGAYTSARQLNAITSAPSDWAFTVPASAGRYNASYDIWIHNSSNRPTNTGGTLELMIWLYQRDTTPIGSQVGQVDIGGTTWVVWYGTHDGFSTVSYVRATNVTSVTGLNLKPFFDDAVTRGYAAAAAYLLGIQAGFEIWEMTQNMQTNSFSVSVN